MPESFDERDCIHELGNAIAIARANVEAMIDGVMDVTPDRLRNVAGALRSASEHLEELRRRR